MMMVKVVRIPGIVAEVGLEDNATVADALAAANVTPSDNEHMSVNGQTVDSTYVLHDADRLILARQAKSAAR